jgi:proteic killer suppression protein
MDDCLGGLRRGRLLAHHFGDLHDHAATFAGCLHIITTAIQILHAFVDIAQYYTDSTDVRDHFVLNAWDSLTTTLRQQYRRAVKAYGEDTGKRYILGINTIKQARDIEELMKLPVLRCHPLKGSRAGQYAVNITGFYRLIFSLEGEMLEIARIEEVSKHYGD